MAYITQSELKAVVPPQFVLEALDDDEDGVEDPGLWAAVETRAAMMIDQRLGQSFSVPFTAPLPAIVYDAAVTFCAEALYLRRGIHGEDNPHTEMAENLRKKLDRIGKGEIPLTPEKQPELDAGTLISEPSKTYNSSGGLSI